MCGYTLPPLDRHTHTYTLPKDRSKTQSVEITKTDAEGKIKGKLLNEVFLLDVSTMRSRILVCFVDVPPAVRTVPGT